MHSWEVASAARRRVPTHVSDGETGRVALRRRAGALVVVALLGLVLAHAAFAGDPAGLSPRGPDSPQAGRIEDIYWLLIAITGAIFILVEGALVLFVIRFRNRGRSRTLEGPQIHGATRLELIWTAIPVVILAAIVAFVLVKLPGINSADSARAAGPPLIVKVEGRQFYWNFIYPNGVIQVERMRVPARRDVKLVISSEDVDHSWWIPALQGKFDAIPGKTNHLWFSAGRTGTFQGQCGEFCGYEHPHMVATVEALPNSDFQSWYDKEAQAQGSGTSDLGKMTFQGVCATCHGFQGQGGYGPDLRGNPIFGQPDAIKTLLRNGGIKMPAVGRGWNTRQMNALLAYVKRFAGSR
jgi:cytochrome c oxidase subunit 2